MNNKKLLTILLSLPFIITPPFSILGWGTLYFMAIPLLFFWKTEKVSLKTFDWLYIGALVLFTCSAFIPLLVKDSWTWSYFDKFIRYTLAALAYITLIKHKNTTLHLGLIKVGFYAAATIGFLYAAYQKIFLGIHLAHAGIFCISFGEIMAAVAMLCLVKFDDSKHEKLIWRLSSSALAIMASLMAGTKGAWIAYPALMLIVAEYYLQRKPLLKWGSYLISLTLIITILALIPFTRERMSRAGKDVYHFFTEENYTFTSQGGRLQMWETTWEIYKDSPIIGVGPGLVNDSIIARNLRSQNAAIRGEFKKHTSIVTHAHNEWLEALAAQGIIGFISYLSILFLPMILALKNRKVIDPTTRCWVYFTLLINTAFFIFGLTQCFHSAPREFWLAFNVLSFALLRIKLSSKQESPL